MVSSVVSRAGQRRTTSYDGHQNRLATQPELIAAGAPRWNRQDPLPQQHRQLVLQRGRGEEALGPHVEVDQQVDVGVDS